jgi:uncharacterized cofD-like protein
MAYPVLGSESLNTGNKRPPHDGRGLKPAADSPRIVALGGGTGLPAVLEGLCDVAVDPGEQDPDAITAVVTVTDEGGSSGRLRHQLGVLPPGDVRNCLVALAHRDSPFRPLLQHRFDDDSGHDGHALGNLLLSALSQVTGDFAKAIDQLGTMIGSRGRVMPTTTQDVRLRAELESGEIHIGEMEIIKQRSPIRHLSLNPSPRPLPHVVRALVNADGIVVGPGSLYTSVLPNLLVEGIAATIYGVNAVRIYVANLMTEPGETDHYTLDDHLRVIRAHAGFDLFDYILVNRRPIDEVAAGRYAERGSQPVVAEPVLKFSGNAHVIECDLAIEWGGRKIRHHPPSLARAIRALIRQGRPSGHSSPALSPSSITP